MATLDLEQDDPTVIGRMQEAAIAGAAEVALGVPEGASVRAGPPTPSSRGGSTRRFAQCTATTWPTKRPLPGSCRAPSSTMCCSTISLWSRSKLFRPPAATARSSCRSRARAGRALPLAERVHLRWRTLIGLNAAPLRIANAFCAAGAGLAFVYSVYVIGVYLVKESVAPGWTTVSLMLSGMFFMLSVVLWLLSEYLVLVLDAGARRARYEIGEEFASNVQTRRARLNVETEA